MEDVILLAEGSAKDAETALRSFTKHGLVIRFTLPEMARRRSTFSSRERHRESATMGRS